MFSSSSSSSKRQRICYTLDLDDEIPKPIPQINLNIINKKIEEVQNLLDNLYEMKQYFENVNFDKKERNNCSYIS